MNGIGTARWTRIGLLIFLAYLFNFIDRTNISMAAPLLAKIVGPSSFSLGVLFSSFFWGYVVTMIPGGWAAQKYSAKAVVLGGMVVWVVVSAATALMHSMTGLIVMRVILGLAEGVTFPAYMVLVSRWFPRQERARYSSVLLMCVPISGVIVAPLSGWLIHAFGWRAMFVVEAAPAAVVAVLIAWLLSDSPERDPRLSTSEREWLRQQLQQEHEDAFEEHPRDRVRPSWLQPTWWALGLLFLFWDGGQYAFGLWLPTVVKTVTRTGIITVGLISALPPLVGLISMLINGNWSDHRGRRDWFVLWPIAVAGIGLLMGSTIPGVGAVGLVLLLAITAIGLYAPFGPWWAWIVEYSPPEAAGVMLGFIDTAGNLGGVVAPLLVGLAAGGGNVVHGLYVLAIGLLISAALTLWVALAGAKFRATSRSRVASS